VDIRVRVKGGGYTSQIYAVRQAIAKAIVAYYQKYVDEASKKEIKEILMSYDRSLLVAGEKKLNLQCNLCVSFINFCEPDHCFLEETKSSIKSSNGIYTSLWHCGPICREIQKLYLKSMP